jgi:hypothetical protein
VSDQASRSGLEDEFPADVDIFDLLPDSADAGRRRASLTAPPPPSALPTVQAKEEPEPKPPAPSGGLASLGMGMGAAPPKLDDVDMGFTPSILDAGGGRRRRGLGAKGGRRGVPARKAVGGLGDSDSEEEAGKKDKPEAPSSAVGDLDDLLKPKPRKIDDPFKARLCTVTKRDVIVEY